MHILERVKKWYDQTGPACQCRPPREQTEPTEPVEGGLAMDPWAMDIGQCLSTRLFSHHKLPFWLSLQASSSLPI